MNTRQLSKLLLASIVWLSPLYALSSQAQSETMISADGTIYGTVVETMDAGGYTYVQLDTEEGKLWAAGPVTALTTGSMVVINPQMPMSNFHSNALERDFELIYFVPGFGTDQAEPQEGAPDPHSTLREISSAPVTGIKKADNGNTIAEIHADKTSLNGKPVLVRGKVVKYTAEILGKNWIHIADGSSDSDLVVTTDSSAQIGDVILISGALTLDKDFGYGYRYEVIVEDAKVTVE